IRRAAIASGVLPPQAFQYGSDGRDARSIRMKMLPLMTQTIGSQTTEETQPVLVAAIALSDCCPSDLPLQCCTDSTPGTTVVNSTTVNTTSVLSSPRGTRRKLRKPGTGY